MGDPGRIAPSVEKGWRDAFILELRLLGVRGDRIGDALMTVETHLHDAGETASAAFGEPQDYAAAVAGGPRSEPLGMKFVLAMALGLAGMLALNRAFTAWLAGRAVEVSVGDVVVSAVVAGLLVVLVLAAKRVLRSFVEHRWIAFVLPVVLIGGLAAIVLLLPHHLATWGVPLVGAVGILLLVVSSVLLVTDQGVDDPIRPPGRPNAPTPYAAWSVALLLPGFTALLLGLTALGHWLA